MHRTYPHALIFSILIFCSISKADQLVSTESAKYNSFEYHSDFGPTESEEIALPNRHFILAQFYNDLSYLVSNRDFYMIVGGLALTPSAFDDGFQSESNRLGVMWGNSRFADSFLEFGEIVGDVKSPLAIAAVSWSAGKISGSDKFQNFGYDLVRVQAISGLLTVSMKGIISRTRPDGAPYSYPSGHTSSAFATAGAVYKNFGKGWGITAFAAASLVGLSRLQENKHYLSDVTAGAILGTYVALKLSGNSAKNHSIEISPYGISNATGLAMSLKF